MVKLEYKTVFRTRKGKKGMVRYPIKELVVCEDDGTPIATINRSKKVVK